MSGWNTCYVLCIPYYNIALILIFAYLLTFLYSLCKLRPTRAIEYPTYCKPVTGDPNKTIERPTSIKSFRIPANVSINAEVFPINITTATFSKKAIAPFEINTIPNVKVKIRSYGSSDDSKKSIAGNIKAKHMGAI